MATVHESSALKCDTSNKSHSSCITQIGLFCIFSMSALLLDGLMPGDSSVYKEILGVSLGCSLALAAKGWLLQRTLNRKTAESVALTCFTNDDDTIEKPSSPSDVDCREVAQGCLGDAADSEADKPCFVRATVLAISHISDPACVESFFKRISDDGLEPSPIMQRTFMSICMRKPNAYDAEAFLTRLLKISVGADIDAFTSFVDTCVHANDLGLSVDVESAYSSLVHACLLLDY